MNATKTGWTANIIGALLLISGIQFDAATLQEFANYLNEFGFNVTPARITAAMGLIGLAVNQLLITIAKREQPPSTPSQINSQSGFFMPHFATVLVVLSIAVTFLPGCAALNNNAQSKPLIQIATMKIIEADASHAKERAARIRAFASEGKTFLDSGDVSVSLLEGAIKTRLAALDLQPSDRVLAAALVEAVVSEINSRVGTGTLSPDQKITVSEVLGYVISATEFYQ